MYIYIYVYVKYHYAHTPLRKDGLRRMHSSASAAAKCARPNFKFAALRFDHT